MKEKNEGKLIALEGPDGCGKSTQTELLAKFLESNDYEIVVTKEPTKNPIGKIIRESLKGKIELTPVAEALLFASDRILHNNEIIIPNLKNNKIVITERYLYSSLAYQNSRGLKLDWVEEINKHALRPDLSIIIDIPPEIGLERMNNSRDLDTFDKNVELQRKVRRTYKKLAAERNIPMIDGTQTEEEIQAEIGKTVRKMLSS